MTCARFRVEGGNAANGKRYTCVATAAPGPIRETMPDGGPDLGSLGQRRPRSASSSIILTFQKASGNESAERAGQSSTFVLFDLFGADCSVVIATRSERAACRGGLHHARFRSRLGQDEQDEHSARAHRWNLRASETATRWRGLAGLPSGNQHPGQLPINFPIRAKLSSFTAASYVGVGK